MEEKAECNAAEVAHRSLPGPGNGGKVWRAWTAFLEKAEEVGRQSKLAETARKCHRNWQDNHVAFGACCNACFGEDMDLFLKANQKFPPTGQRCAIAPTKMHRPNHTPELAQIANFDLSTLTLHEHKASFIFIGGSCGVTIMVNTFLTAN